MPRHARVLLRNALANAPTLSLDSRALVVTLVKSSVLSAAIVMHSVMDSSGSYGNMDDATEDPLGCRLALALALAVAEASLTTGRFSD